MMYRIDRYIKSNVSCNLPRNGLNRALQRCQTGDVTLCNESCNLSRSFSYSGAALWNNLPDSLKKVGSVDRFKRNLKKISNISDSHTAVM